MTEIDYDNEKEFNETVDKFEPMHDFPMSADDVTKLTTNAIVSIAISLKRIADKLELSQKQPIVMNKEEYENYLTAKERYDIGKAAMEKASDSLIKS